MGLGSCELAIDLARGQPPRGGWRSVAAWMLSGSGLEVGADPREGAARATVAETRADERR